MSERLDRIESAIEANAQTIAAIQAGQQANTQAIGLLSERTEIVARAVERMTEVQLQTFAHMEQMQSNIEAMQAEVRGLQTENRRILDHLFGEEPADDD